MALGLLNPGERGEIIGLEMPEASCCGNCGCREKKMQEAARVESMGLRIGKQVEMLNNEGGLVLLRVDDSRIAIDHSVAMKITIRR